MLRIGLFLLGAVLATSAQAGYVRTDWKVSSDARAVLHEETGIEWLRLKETDGKSVNEVLSQTGAGQQYEGWRIATQSEVSAFVESFYPDFTINKTYNNYQYYGYDDHYWVEHKRFRDVMGETAYLSGTNSHGTYYRSFAWGYALDDEGNVTLNGTRHNNWGGSPRLYELNIFSGYAQNVNADNASGYAGVFMVSDGGTTLSSRLDPTLNINNPNAPINTVPVSSIGGLALIALGGFLRRRRR